MRIKLTIEYDGTAYAGWQRQENALAVQQVVEDALTKLTNTKVVISGASRTDAGVHALGQVAHFDTESRIPPDKYSYALNTMLPPDIRISASEAAPENFHARFSTAGKLYRYQILSAHHAGALTRNTHAHVIYPLNDELMAAELKSLTGTHDFAAFAASGSIVKDTVRTIYTADMYRRGNTVTLFVSGNGFLYNMVRIIVGTLVETAFGRFSPEDMPDIIASRDRSRAGMTAPAEGLYLNSVKY